MVNRRSLPFLLVLVLGVAFVVGLFLYLRWNLAAGRPPPAPAAALGPWYELHFTAPVYPDRADNRRSGLDEKLVLLIDSAQRTIDAAVYDFDLENVARALAAAKQRGVRVRFVTDTDTVASDDPAIKKALGIVREAGIPIVDDRRSSIMHHKFLVADGERVWTGSWNWTVGDTYRLNNNAINLASPELAQNYTAEFEKMFLQRRFGASKPSDIPHRRIAIDTATIETYFSQDDVASRIAERIQGATTSVQFLAFSFTHDRIGRAMLDRGGAGLPVRGVFETTGSRTSFSEYGRLKEAGLEVYTDGSPYAMHHKVIVVDDHTVIFGSFNFSQNADDDNDENLLIVQQPQLAEAFLGEVERMVRLARNPVPAKK